jgi:hypothetical protein
MNCTSESLAGSKSRLTISRFSPSVLPVRMIAAPSPSRSTVHGAGLAAAQRRRIFVRFSVQPDRRVLHSAPRLTRRVLARHPDSAVSVT